MPYGIVINLDYEEHPQEICRFLWYEIKERMLSAGFRMDGRTFVINLGEQEACELARKTIDSIEDHLEYHHKHLPKYIREFYGFPIESRTNLLVPPASAIEVTDIPWDDSGRD